MSTRGVWSIRKYGIDKIVDYWCDSYPSYLGKKFIHLAADCQKERRKKISMQ